MPDAIDAIAGAPAITGLRELRPDPKRFAQGSYDALLAPHEPGAIGIPLRARIAQRVAELHGADALAAHYAGFAGGTVPDALQSHLHRLSTEPGAARAEHVAPLLSAGYAPRDIVSVSQLISFVAFQARLLHGLRLQSGAHTPAGRRPPDASPDLGWTLDPRDWASWLPTVRLDDATPAQIAVLEESNARAKTSPYYLLLVHDPDALLQRSKLFNSVMYGPGGIKRADRELSAVAESRINGCAYCASVHARLFAQLTKEPAVMQRIYEQGTETELDPRRRAIVDYAVRLSATPPTAGETDMAALRAQGLSDIEILDVTHVVAMFAWANRLMQTLGEPVVPA